MFKGKSKAISAVAVVTILMLCGVVIGVISYGISINVSYEAEVGTNEAYEILTGEEMPAPVHTATGVYPLPGGISAPKRTCTIVYKSSTGLQLGTQSVLGPEGTTITLTPKTFSGYDAPGAQDITFQGGREAVIIFVYNPIKYFITYELNGGTLEATNKTVYTIEDDAFTLNNPVKTGYTFAGWTGANGSTPQVTAILTKGSIDNKSYTANWGENSYTIKYNANGGSGTMASETLTYTQEKALAANAFTRTGYTFQGWATTPDGTVKYTDKQKVSKLSTGEDIELYAVWKANSVTVTFDTGYDDIPASFTSKTVAYDSKYGTLPTAEIEGYRFLGWYTSATGGTEVTADTIMKNTKAHTLYARWLLPTIDLLMMYPGSGVSKFETFEKHAYEFDKGVTYTGQPIQGQWESFCIALSDLDIGKTYQLKFDAALSDRTCIRDTTNYPIGCRIDKESSFATSNSTRTYTWTPTSAAPSTEGFVIEFVAEKEVMFWQWELSKLRNPKETYGKWKKGVENFEEGYFDLTLNNVSLTKID